MKFAFVIFRYFPFGGLQRDLVRITEEAVSRGHTVTIFLAQQEEPFPEMRNVTIRMVPYRGWTNHGQMKSFASNVQRLLKQESFGRILMFNRMGGGDFYFAADNCLETEWRSRHSALILSLFSRYRTFLNLEREIFAQEAKTKIFTIIPRQQQDYQKRYGTPAERFTALPPGIDANCRRQENYPEVRRKIRESLGIGADKILLIQTAFKFRTKGVDRSILAISALPPEWKEKCVFIVIGNDSSQRFRKLADRERIRALFPGFRRDLPELLAGADLMIHPARNEAAGAVIAEALVMGVPVIASGACGYAPFAAETDSGLVTKEPFCQEELNGVLLNALENLAVLREKTEQLISSRDFYRRAAVAMDHLERG